ncbi:Transcription initiation factor IIA, gamma subunit, beta-barrel domain protein, partial [Necator americanus]
IHVLIYSSSVSDADVREVVDDSSYALQAHEQDCFSVAVAAERWLATGGEDDVAYLWDYQISDSDPVLKVDHKDSVTYVVFNNSQTLLATGDMSGHIIVTQLRDLKNRAKIDDCNDLEWMCWHTTSDILFAGDKDGIMWMWLIGPSGVVQSKVYAGSGLPCTVGHILPDGKRLLAGYSDGAARLWNLKDGTCTTLSILTPVSAVHHHVSQPVGVLGAEDGSVHVVNTSNVDKLVVTAVFRPLLEPSKENDEENVENCVECVQFSPFNSWLAVGRNDGTLCIYEIDSAAPRSIFRAPSAQAMVRALWSVEGSTPFLCVGCVDGFVRVFDARDGSLCQELGNGGDEVLDMALLRSNPMHVVTAGKMIPLQLAEKVLFIYDKAINKALAQKAKNKMYFKASLTFFLFDVFVPFAKAEKLRAYRHCDNVWTFLMEGVDFRDSIRVNRVKFVACDGSTKLASS